MNTNIGFILRKKQDPTSLDPPLYWRATGRKMINGRFMKERGKAALFRSRKDAELFRTCLSLQHQSEVIPA
jgi:hypothetical protein